MEILYWIIGIVVVGFFALSYAGGRKEQAYRQIIEELMQQLTQDPAGFFYPDYQWLPNNRIHGLELTELLLRRVTLHAIKRNVRSFEEVTLIPSDIQTLSHVKADFQKLFMLANSIANDRH